MSSSTVLPCPFVASPPLNTDIAGIGIRVSIYVQALLTVIFLTLSPDITHVYEQCFPFVIMNISVIIAAFVLGFSPNPQISLQDAVVAWFFTFIPIFVLMMGGHKLRNRNKIHNAINSSDWDTIPTSVTSIIMWVLHAAFSLTLFRRYKTFGSTPNCNDAARAFIFGTHAVTNRWLIGLAVAYGLVLSAIFLSLVYRLFIFTFLFCAIRKPRNEEEKKEAERQHKHMKKLIAEATAEANFQADYRWGFIAFSLLAIWIAFIEVTVVKNNFAPADSPAWQFGQIFPMILLAVPVLATARAISEFIKDTPERRKRMMQDPAPEQRADLIATLDKIMDDPESPNRVSDSSDSPLLNGFVRGVAFAIGYAFGLLNVLWMAIVIIVSLGVMIGISLGIIGVMGTIMMLTGNAILRAHSDRYTDNRSAAIVGATGAFFASLVVGAISAPFLASSNPPKMPWAIAMLITVVFSTLTGTIGSKILLHHHVDLGAIDSIHATRAGAVGGAIFSVQAHFFLSIVLSSLFQLFSPLIAIIKGWQT